MLPGNAKSEPVPNYSGQHQIMTGSKQKELLHPKQVKNRQAQ